jgi:DNA-directed RNA polymerase subunit beta'
MIARWSLLNFSMINKMGVESIKARSTITCDARYGVCAACYGNDMARGHKIGVGEAVASLQSCLLP